jgi:hypothetical protein
MARKNNTPSPNVTTAEPVNTPISADPDNAARPSVGGTDNAPSPNAAAGSANQSNLEPASPDNAIVSG